MAYPKEVYLSPEREETIKLWLMWQINNHRMERSGFVDDITRYNKDYWAVPNETVRKFPFQGAANIVIPITAIVAEAVHARNMQRLFSQDQLVNLKFFDPNWSPFDRDIELFLDWQLMNQMKFKAKAESAIWEQELFGTGVIKDGYMRLVRNVIYEENEFEVPVYTGPCIDSVPLANFLMPFSALDPQTAPWCGEEHVTNQYELKQLEQAGLFRPGTYDRLSNYYTMANNLNLSSDKFRQSVEKLQNQQPAWPSRLGWYEIYAGFAPQESDGKQKKLIEYVFLYHLDSNTLLSIRHNWFYDGRRPYEIGVMQKVANRWLGIGIAKQNEQIQRSITTQHRQRLDAGTIANATMMKVKRLSGISPSEPVYPGKLWFVEDMGDIEPLQFNGTYPTAANNEQQTLYYGQQRSGINDLTLGMNQVGTPGTATSDMARLQEGSHKHDYYHSNILDFLSRVIRNTVGNICQWGTSDPRYFEFRENGDIVRQFFDLPPSLLKSGILAEIRMVSQSDNKLLDRNNWMQLVTIFQQYYANAFQSASLIDTKIAVMVAAQSIKASTEAFEHILNTFDIPNAHKLSLRQLIDGLLPQVGNNDGRALQSQGPQQSFPVSGNGAGIQTEMPTLTGEVGPSV